MRRASSRPEYGVQNDNTERRVIRLSLGTVAHPSHIAMLGRSCQIDTVDKDARRVQERALPQLERIDHVAPIGFGMHQIELKPAVQLVKKARRLPVVPAITRKNAR